MQDITFEAWPKIARLNRDMVVTEKIDGTNAAVIVTDDLQVAAQSRRCLITPEADNFGFARWVQEHSETLAWVLGPGRHFGEWWGSGIQRGYGLRNGERRFSLFNVNRYIVVDLTDLPGVELVPVLYTGPFSVLTVQMVMDDLRRGGSSAAPGFMQPEGVVVFHDAARVAFKATLVGDEKPKGQAA